MGSRGEPVLVSPGLAGRLFHFVMIKPTHYDDDGYPILWFRSAIPSTASAVAELPFLRRRKASTWAA